MKKTHITLFYELNWGWVFEKPPQQQEETKQKLLFQSGVVLPRHQEGAYVGEYFE